MQKTNRLNWYMYIDILIKYGPFSVVLSLRSLRATLISLTTWHFKKSIFIFLVDHRYDDNLKTL